MKRDPLRLAYEKNPGTFAHAERVLRWWADDESDDPDVIEMKKQAIECARSLRAFDRAAKKVPLDEVRISLDGLKNITLHRPSGPADTFVADATRARRKKR